MRDLARRFPQGRFAINTDSPQAVGLAAFYPMAQPGGNLLDYAGKSLNGTLTSGILWSQGFNSFNSLYCPGDSSHKVTISGAPDFSATDQVSIFAWVLFIASQAFAGIIFDNRSYNLQADGGTFKATHMDNAGSEYQHQHSSALNDGKWHLVGLTYDGTTQKSYIDGIQRTPTSTSGTDGNGLGYGNADHNGYIGATPTFPSNALTGFVGPLFIYNYPVPAGVALSLYQPSTRFDLWYPLGQRIFGLPAAALARSQAIIIT